MTRRPRSTSSTSSSASSSRKGSPVSSPQTHEAPKKRTRASKPKVRTGCITCKIRRVKCGEEKPACLRCTSTGRTCDGYDLSLSPKNSSHDSLRDHHETAKTEFFRASQSNEALRSMRPIIADIEGSELEKRFFHDFRRAPEHSTPFGSMCDFTGLWKRVALRLSHQDDAVKHAIIAVGAAYRLATATALDSASLTESAGLSKERLEVFIIEQHTAAISRLQQHVSSPSPESMQTTLVCCLAFVALETIRQDHAAAASHLNNGLNILQTLPPAEFDFLADPAAWHPDSSSSSRPDSMQDIIRLFGRLEMAPGFSSAGTHPVVASKGYAYRRVNPGWSSVRNSSSGDFRDLKDAHTEICCFVRDVTARLHEINSLQQPLWADTNQMVPHASLLARAGRLNDSMGSFLSTLEGSADAQAPDWYMAYLDLLHFMSAEALLVGMGGSPGDASTGPSSLSPSDLLRQIRRVNALHSDMLSLVEDLHRSTAGARVAAAHARPRPSIFPADDDNILEASAAQVAASADPVLREHALRLLLLLRSASDEQDDDDDDADAKTGGGGSSAQADREGGAKGTTHLGIGAAAPLRGNSPGVSTTMAGLDISDQGM